nr:retrovirus-related Pol polyprotein from transposon TNT 1-94 [Tanacetum cinerariifolium]
MSILEITSDSESKSDVTLNTYVPKKTRPTSIKVSPSNAIKKKTENKPQAFPESYSNKKADSSTKQLLLTLMKEGKYKGLKAEMDVLTKMIDDLTKGKNKKGNNEKRNSEKGLIAESFDWDKEYVSSEDEGTTKIRTFMAIAKDEPSTCSKVTLDQLVSEQIPGNIVNTLEGRESLISLADLTLNIADVTLNTYVPKKTRPTSIKVSPSNAIKKRTENKPQAFPESYSNKKADSSTKQLLLTLMEEDYLKRSVWYLDSGCSRHVTGVKQYLHKYSKESGPKVVFIYESSGDTEGYDSINCNEITITRVAYVNGQKHNLISISQLTMENLNEVRVKELSSDNGTDFRSHKLEEFYDEKGISQNFSSSCTPEQNGLKLSGCSTSEDKKWKKHYMSHSVKIMKPSLNLAQKGYNHQKGINYEETFALVARLEAIRIFLAYAAYMDFMVYQMDVKSPFLNVKISEEVYVQQPLGFESSEYPNHVCKLDKALYGPKQAPKGCSIILKRHGKIAYDVFRGRSPNIIYFHVFGCPMDIHNYGDHLGKFDEKADDGFFLGYSPGFVSPEESLEFTSADDQPVFNEHDHFDLVENFELAEIQDNVIIEPISGV